MTIFSYFIGLALGYFIAYMRLSKKVAKLQEEVIKRTGLIGL